MTDLKQCAYPRGKKYIIYFTWMVVLLFLKSQGAQVERDTVVFELKPEEIDKMDLIGDDRDVYWIDIVLKEKYHADFADLTDDNIGNFLMIIYKNEVYAQPVIRSRIGGGRFMLGPFESKDEAENIFEMIREGRKPSSEQKDVFR